MRTAAEGSGPDRSGVRLREGHFESMLEGYAYCRMIFDRGVPVDYVHLDANPAYRTLTGLPDPIGRRVTELIPGIRESNPELFESYGRVVATGEPQRLEIDVPGLGRTYRISAWRPEPGHFAVFFADVTEERRTARELARREEMLRQVTEGASDVIWTLDLDLGRFLYVSPSIQRLRGFTPEEVMALPYQAALTPESVALVQSELASRAGELDRGESPTAVLAVEEICRDGSTIWTELTVRALRNPATGHLEVHGVSRDVTARRRAELARADAARFSRGVLDGLGAHIAVVDESGTVLATNEAWRRFARENGGDARQCLEGADYLAACDRAAAAGDASAAAFAIGLRAVLAGDRELFEQEYPCHSPAFERWFVGRATPFPGAGPRRVVVAHEDISARVAGELALRESMVRYQTLVETSPDAILVNRGGAIEMVNPALVELVGADSAAVLVGHDPFDLVHPDDRAKVAERIGKLLDSGAPAPREEFRVLRYDGSVVIVESVAIRLGEGEPPAIQVILRDVTERKRAEEELRRGEARLRLALEAANQGLWDFDVARDEESVSPEYASMLGYDPGGFHETDAAWIERMHPEDRERVRAAYRDCLEGRSAEYRAEFRQRAADGSWKWVLSLGRVVERDERGRPLRMLGTRTDITERKAADERIRVSEQRLRLALEAAQQGLWDLDLRTGRAEVTPEYATMLGYAPHEFHETNAAWLERMHPEDRDAVGGIYREYVAGVLPDYRVEFRQRTKTGEWKWILSAGRIVEHDAEGRPLRMLGTHTDITARKLAELGLRESEGRFRLFIEHAPAALAVFDREMRYLAASSRWRSDYGLGERELVGRSHYEVFPEIGESWKEVHRRALDGEVVRAEEDRFERADGRMQWLRWEVRPWLDGTGAVAGILIFSEDVTARKEAAAALAESEAHFRALAETTFDWIWEVDAAGRYTFVSPRVAELLGYLPEEVLGRTPFELMPEGEARRVSEIFAEIVARREPFVALENVNRHRDGRLVVLESSGVPFFGREGDFRGYRGMDRDITARKRAERRLATQAAVSRVLAGAASLEGAAREVLDAIGRSEEWQVGSLWVLDPDLDVMRCAEVWREEGFAADRLEARSREMLLRRGEALPGRVWASGHPEVLIPVRQGRDFPRGEAAAEAGLSGAVAFPIVAGENILAVVEFGGTSLWEVEPEIHEMLDVIGRQLGQFLERRRAEEAVARFVAGSPGVTYALRVLPEGLRLVWIGGNLEEMSGWNLEQARAENWWTDHLHPDDRDRMFAANQFPDAGDRQSFEFRFLRPDGTSFWVHDERRLLRDAEGRPSEVIGSWIDITEQKRLEEQLRTSQKLEAIGRLAGGVAHDFNNILTVISGNGELLAQSLPAESPDRLVVGEIRDAADRAAALTRQLLAFSRSQVLAPVVLEMNGAVHRVEGMLRRLIGEDVALTVDLAPNAGWVRVDPGQLEQVIVNLAVNARDAMPQGGRLTLSTKALDPGAEMRREGGEPGAGRWVRLEVSDTGTGMPPEVRQRLFEPFFTTKGQGKGTGLGLATVHGIVTQSGGRIEVDSEPGRGATFAIDLPAVDPPTEEAERTAAPPRQRGHETILLVEDEEAVRRIARIALESRGYRVLVAPDGASGVAVADAHGEEIDLVVTDLVMPGMSGTDLAAELRARRPGLRVLFVSGYVEDELSRHGLVEAEVAFLHKPFSLAELAARVRAALDAPPRAAQEA